LTPEARARELIDHKLQQAGWIVQDMKQLNLGAAVGVAVREYPTDSGPADYVLFVDRQAVGVIEAKKDSRRREPDRHRGADRALRRRALEMAQGSHAAALPVRGHRPDYSLHRWRRPGAPLARSLPLLQSPRRSRTGLANPTPCVVAWPSTCRRWHGRIFASARSARCTGLEKSLAQNKPRALVHMATGAGKTFTAITSVYRLLKFGGARRILFLVDTRNLGKQAHQEFMAYTPPDDGRKFTELYNVQRLASAHIDPHSQVCISTIQRMYSILSGEPMDESAEDLSLNEIQQTPKQEKLVRYNPAVPVETFDFIVIDECHRSIYNLWKQVLDYFDATLIGLTATPDKRTFGFFNENIVAEYTYEQSVADGVNVGYDVYEIETEITRKGAELKAREWVDHRDRQTRKKRWSETEEDTVYTGKELDRSVVNVSQIRQVLLAMKTRRRDRRFSRRARKPPRPSSSPRPTATPTTSSTFFARSMGRVMRSARRSPIAPRKTPTASLPAFATTTTRASP
jgi:type I restriction enzyme R subunit